MLKWPQRMAISIGIARGVQFLHTGVAPGVFGNNLNIENILLDDSLNAKVSGYRIPLPSKVSTEDTLCSTDIPQNKDMSSIHCIQFIHFLKLLMVATCQCRCRVLCPNQCFIESFSK